MSVFLPAGTPSPEGFVYPEDRVFTDSQSWWADSEHPFPEARHLHNGAYFPFMKKVKGASMDLDVLVKCHFDPGIVTLLRVQLYDQLKPAVQHSLSFSSPDGVQQIVKNCPVPYQVANDGDGVWFRLKVPIGKCTNDGRVEFRVTANIPKTPAGASAGNRTYNTTRWHCLIDNGKLPVKNYSTADRMGAAGWYTGVGYSNIRVNDLDGVRLFYGGPVSAGQKIRVRGDYSLFVAVDTKPHTTDKGVVLYDGAGGSSWKTVTLPALPPGPHRLYVRTEKTISSPKGTAAGAWFIPFEVS